MNRSLFPFIQLSVAIFVMSSSGTLGRYIDLSPPVIIWTRCTLAALALFIYLKWTKTAIFMGWGKHFMLVLIGSVFLGIHWITYFYSLQLSSVAIGMLSLFTYPVMTSIIEPILMKTRFDPIGILLSIISLIGVYFLAPDLDFTNSHTLGVAIGLLSALFYSVRNIMLKKNIANFSGITLMFYQMAILTILLLPVLFIYDVQFERDFIQGNWEGILLLGVVTTAFGHTLFVKSFRHFTVSTVSIMSTLTPLLGAWLAFIVLNEIPKGHTVIAGCIILLTSMIESVRSIRKNRKAIPTEA